MMPSAPSRTAFATSVASARVGRGARDHRLEHLRRDDHRPRRGAGRAQQVLLEERDLLHRQLDAEVAPRDHHASVTREDLTMSSTAGFVSILATIGTRAVAHQGAQSLDVVGAADERLRHEVDAEIERAGEPFAVAVGDRRQAEPLGGDVHALPGTDRAAAHALASARPSPRSAVTVSSTAPSASRMRSPGLEVVGQTRVGRRRARARRLSPSGRSSNAWPGRELQRVRLRACPAEPSGRAGRPCTARARSPLASTARTSSTARA